MVKVALPPISSSTRLEAAPACTVSRPYFLAMAPCASTGSVP